MDTEKHVLVKNNFYRWSSPLWAWVEKIVHRVETHTLTSKEKISGVVVSEERHHDSVWVNEKGSVTIDIGFLEKDRTKNSNSYS